MHIYVTCWRVAIMADAVDAARPIRRCTGCRRLLYTPRISCPYCGEATVHADDRRYKHRVIASQSYDSAWFTNERDAMLLTIYRSSDSNGAALLTDQQWRHILDRVADILDAELNGSSY